MTTLRHGNTYDVLYIAKGGGSANKTQLLVGNRGLKQPNCQAFQPFRSGMVLPCIPKWWPDGSFKKPPHDSGTVFFFGMSAQLFVILCH